MLHVVLAKGGRSLFSEEVVASSWAMPALPRRSASSGAADVPHARLGYRYAGLERFSGRPRVYDSPSSSRSSSPPPLPDKQPPPLFVPLTVATSSVSSGRPGQASHALYARLWCSSLLRVFRLARVQDKRCC